MAQLLIKAVSASNPDPKADKGGCYKRGDIVVVAGDDHVFSPAEDLPTFIRASLPGVPVEAVQALCDSEVISPAEFAPSALRANRSLYERYKRVTPPEHATRRRYALTEDLLQSGATLSLNQIKDKNHAA